MTTKTTTRTEALTPTRKTRNWLFGLRAFLLVSLLPLVFVAIAAVMMIDREVTAPSWIKSRIEQQAALVLNGGNLRFGAILITVGSDLHPRVRLEDTQLLDADGVTIARIPHVRGLISPRGLILRQDVLMQQIILTGAQINLRRARDGSVTVAFEDDAAGIGKAASLAALLDQVDQVFERSALEALETVQADGLIVNFDDARAGRSWIVDGGTLDLDVRGAQTLLRGDFAVLSGRADVTTIALSYASPRGSREATLSVKIDDAIASDIAAQSPALSWLRDVEAPLSAALRTTLDADAALGPLSATLEIGEGALQPNPATRPVVFDGAKAYLTYDPARDHIAFDQVIVQTDWGEVQAAGQAYLREFQDGLPRALLAQFSFRDIVLNPADLYDVPHTIPAAALDMRLRFEPFSIEVGQLVVTDDQMRMSASADAAATPQGWRVGLDLEIDRIDQAKMMSFWPSTFKPRTHQWFTNNLINGDLFDVVVGLRAIPDQPPRLAAGFEFEDATVQFMRQMPVVTDATGVFALIDNAVTLRLTDGMVVAPEGGNLDIAGTVFTIPDVRVRNAPSVADLVIRSPVNAALSILNQPPFEYLDKAGLPAQLADGRADVTGRIALPLKPRLSNNEVTFEMAAALSDVRTDTLVPGRTLSSGNLAVRADRQGISISGPVRVGDVPAEGTWSQAFGPENGGKSTVDAQIELSQQFLDEFGIALPPGSLDGAADGHIHVDLIRGAAPQFALTSDLVGMRVALPAVGWAKPRDTGGALVVEGTLGTVPEITTLDISGGGLMATGRVDMNPAGGLDAARFSRVRLGNWLDAPVTLQGRGPGLPVGVVIDGGVLDLRRATFGVASDDSGPMTVRLDRLQVTEGIALTGFRGDFMGTDGFSGRFTAQVNGAADVQGTVVPRGGRSAVRLFSEDAGGVIRAAGFMDNARDGTLDLTLLPAGDEGSYDGVLAVRELRVRDAPAIASLLDAISVVGLLQQLDGEGLAFEEVDARFRLTPTQILVTESSAVGPGLGISLDGIYTLASRRIDFQGVVSPFHFINGVGAFLTRKGEGLIGFNFNLSGSVDAPDVVVNPLSAFTPGMFREIFRRPSPKVD